MCAPAAIGMLAVASGVQMAGAAYSASQENAAGKSQQSMYDAQAAQKRMEADYALKLGETRATLSEDQGAINSKIASRQSAQLGATQRAIMAANGVAAGTTAADITGDTMDKRALDQMAIRYNADSKAWEAKTGAAYQSWSSNAEANQYTAAGINARKAGAARANATLLGGAGQVAGNLYQGSLYL